MDILNSLEGEYLKDLLPENSLSLKRKDYSRALIDAYLRLGLEFKYDEYLKNRGLSLKTTPIAKGGLNSVEPLRLCSLNLKDLINQKWENSDLFYSLSGLLILPLIVEAKNLGQPYRRVGKPMIWVPSIEEIELIKSDWAMYKDYALKGAIPAQRGVMTDKLTYPTEASTKFIHMRPHSVKDKFELDAFGNKVRKMAFYLNPARLRTLLLN